MQTEFFYDNQGTNAFLAYEMAETEELDTMGIGMIGNNHIPHILPISFTQIDEKRYLKYNISSKIALENFFSGMVNKKRLLSIFLGICEAIEASEEYMLENSMLVLDKRYIFANVATGEPDLVYLPIIGKGEPADFGTFFKGVMFSTQFDSTEDCGYVAVIINHLNTNTNFSLKSFKTLLYSLKNQSSVGASPTPMASSTPVAEPTPVPPSVPVAKPIPVATPTPVAMPTSMPQPQPMAKAASNTVTKSDTSAVNSGFAIPGMENEATSVTDKALSKKLFGFGKSSSQETTKSTAATATPMGTPRPVATPIPMKTPTPMPAAAAAQNSSPGFTKAQAQPATWAQGSSAQFGQTSLLGGNDIGQTTVLSSGGGALTTVLGVEGVGMETPQMPRAILVQKKNGNRVAIEKVLFRIGTEKTFVDCWIFDNSAVSHSHADILNRDGTYYVRDNNSTNHTYLNGQLLNSNQEYPLQDGDKLVFGNESFEFELK